MDVSVCLCVPWNEIEHRQVKAENRGHRACRARNSRTSTGLDTSHWDSITCCCSQCRCKIQAFLHHASQPLQGRAGTCLVGQKQMHHALHTLTSKKISMPVSSRACHQRQVPSELQHQSILPLHLSMHMEGKRGHFAGYFASFLL